MQRRTRWVLWRSVVAVLATLLSGPAVRGAAAQDAVYLVRHAERMDDEKDSLLSADGHNRAARLSVMLRDAGITHIFTSEYRRTVETAAPLAARLGVSAAVVAADDRTALLARIRSSGPGTRVLVVGHSDTVPALFAALGCTAPVTIAKAEYDNLFVVVPGGAAGPVCLRLRF